VNFAPGKCKIPLRGHSRRKCVNTLPAEETAKHRAKFRWLPLSDIAAVTETRLESLRNFLGALNSPIGLSRYSGPKFTILWGVWRRYCCLTSFFPIVDTCLSCEDTARQSCAMVPRWRFLRHFCVLYFQRAACGTFQTCIVNSH